MQLVLIFNGIQDCVVANVNLMFVSIVRPDWKYPTREGPAFDDLFHMGLNAKQQHYAGVEITEIGMPTDAHKLLWVTSWVQEYVR